MLVLGERSIDLESGVVAGAETGLSLTPKECALLRALNAKRGQTVRHADLHREVFGLAQGTGSRLSRVTAWRLRQKIEPDPTNPVFLLTDHGSGLRLQREVVETDVLGVQLRLVDGELDLRTGRVQRASGAQTLSSQELDLVAHLARHAHRAVGRAELWTEVLGYAASTRSRALDSAISRLRHKLEADPGHPAHLLTVHGKGYRWVSVSEPAAQAPGLVGRQALLALVQDHLRTASVVTLFGAAGVGKTALARAIPSTQWVDLTAAGSEAELAEALGGALDLRLTEADPWPQLRRALRSRPGLFVLDGACEEALQNGLPAGPTWLVTARAPSGCPGELAVLVPELEPEAAVQMLAQAAERTGTTDPGWQDSDRLRPLAERLEGLPLALELAAGRALVLPVEEVLARLDQPGLLQNPTAPERHRSLQAALASSWALLKPQERDALGTLSTCLGFDLTAAEALLGSDALDLLQRLCAFQLVRRQGRYRLPTAVARHAAARRPLGAVEAHARYFAAGMLERTPELGLDVDDPAWALRELGNLRLAAQHHPDRVVAARISIGLARLRGFGVRDTAPGLQQAIAQSERAPGVAAVARALLATQDPSGAQALLAEPAGDAWSEAVRDLYGASLRPDQCADGDRALLAMARFEALGSARGRFDARLVWLGALLAQDPSQAGTHIDAAIEEASRLGDRRGLAVLLGMRGWGVPELDAMLADYDEAIALFTQLGDQNGTIRTRLLRARARGALGLPHASVEDLVREAEATGLLALVQRARGEQAGLALEQGDPGPARALAQRSSAGWVYPEDCAEMAPLVHLLEGRPARALPLFVALSQVESSLWVLLCRWELGEDIRSSCEAFLHGLMDRSFDFHPETHRVPFMQAVAHALCGELSLADQAGAQVPRWTAQASLWHAHAAGRVLTGNGGPPEVAVLRRVSQCP